MRLDWPDLLDALEERTRRCAKLVDSGVELPVDDLPLTAEGPMPPELALRAQLLLAETRRVEQVAARRAREARTALHYQRA